MKKLLLLAIILIGCSFIKTNVSAQDNNQHGKQLNRILIFTFKPEAPADSIKLVDNVFVEISKLPVIKSFTIGVEKESDKKPKSIKHIYMLGFETEQDIENYAKSQQHKNLFKFTKLISGYKIFDYWTEN